MGDGTRIIFDRALGRGCVVFEMGIINFTTPCLKMNRKKNENENNKSRLNATIVRWGIEKGFGNLGNVWKIFSSQSIPINNYYIPIFGKWLDIAGAICNHIGIGLANRSEKRLKQLQLMKMKNEQDLTCKYSNNPYVDILNKFANEKELIKYWIKCKNVKDIINESPYWTMEKLINAFKFNEEDLKLIGGGPYTYEMGKWYLIHSKFFIEIYVSVFKNYEKYILIRGIKPRMTRNWDKNHAIVRGSKRKLHTTDDLDYIENGEKWKSRFHMVLLGQRPLHNIIVNDSKFKYSKNVLSVYYGCTCVHGSRSICGDSHVLCGLHLINMIINGKTKIEDEIVSKLKWAKVFDINHFKAYIRDLNEKQKEMFVNQFMSNENVQPLMS